MGRGLGKLLTAIGLIAMLASATPMVSWWVRAYTGPLEQPRGQVLIVLAAASDDQGGISYSSYWRVRYALLAWQTGSFKTMILSGGGAGMFNFLVAEGIPRQAILTEWRSKSTRENAIETAKLLANVPGKRVLLTSDFHIYRALRVFRKQGIEAAPMAVPDVSQAAEHWQGRIPALETMALETIKIAYYRCRGWM
jgi:uncharacterized SAM-binding protein YcdF (DUF218 family)